MSKSKLLTGRQTTAVVVFAKNPYLEPVKTRLANTLGAVTASLIYRSLLRDALRNISELKNTQGYLACSPSSKHTFFANLANEFSMLRLNQTGDDLGQRMLNSIVDIHSSHNIIAIVGSDTPLLPIAEINAAFNQKNDWDVLLGPAYDGGYYLIAIKQPIPELFADICWSTAEVFHQTKRKCQDLNLKIKELPPSLDIDEEEDLSKFSKLLSDQHNTNLESYQLLKKLCLA